MLIVKVVGSNVAINYNSRPEPAKELAEDIEKRFGVRTHVIQGVRPLRRTAYSKDRLPSQ